MQPANLITSPHNPRVKNALRLRSSRQRRKQGRILIDGVREILRAQKAGIPFHEVFVCRSMCSGADQAELAEQFERAGAVLLEVTEPVFRKLAFGSRTEGVLAVAEPPRIELSSLAVSGMPLFAVLEAVEKPGNVGAVVRTADGAGLNAVILAGPRTDLFNPNAIRASLGTIFSLPVLEARDDECLAWLRVNRLQVVAARVDGTLPYCDVDFRLPTAIVLGSEAEGLSQQWRADDVLAVKLPMLGAADSLNVSAAAAVLFYEAVRQRGGDRHLR